MEQKKLKEILNDHKLWLVDELGERADLHGADLHSADLRGADLRRANLYNTNLKDTNLNRANMSYVDLRGAELWGADLSYADLCYVNLSYAVLHDVNLSGASIYGANFCGADLRRANLNDVKHNETTAFFALQCPEDGAFTAWKKCGGVLVKLLIPADAERSSGTSRKCRASKAVVLEVIGADKGISTYDETFVYEVGKEVVPDSFDFDRWNECSHGIHFFVTRKEAENY